MDNPAVRDIVGDPEARLSQLNGHSRAPANPSRATSNKSEVRDEARDRTQVELDPVAVYSCDASGVITFCNERAVQLWGRRPAVGDTDERFCGSHMLYSADGSYLPHEQCPMADVLTGKVPGVHDAEVHIERPDGSRVIVIVNIAPLIDDGGNIVGAINSFYDIADRNHVESASPNLLAR